MKAESYRYTARLVGRFRPHWPPFLLASILMALGAATQGGLVFLIERVLDGVLIAGDTGLLKVIPFALVGLYLLKGLARLGSQWLVHRMSQQVVRDLRNEIYGSLLRQDMAWHRRQGTGEILSRISRDVGETEGMGQALAAGVEKPLTLAALLGAALWMDWQLSVAALVVIPFVGLAIHLFADRLRKSFRDSLDNLGTLSAQAEESLSGMTVIQAFRGEERRQALFEAENHQQYQLQMRAALARVLPSPVVEALAAVGVALVIAYGGARVLSGELLPGELMAFLVAVGLMNMPLKGLSDMAAQAQKAAAGAEGVFGLIDRVSPIQGGETRLSASRCDLSFEGVALDYGEGWVLQNLEFRIAAGERVAVVGASGEGKSSLVALLARLLDPSGGRILLNGVDLRDYSLDSLRQHVALVTQEPFLFDDSVLENVRLARPEASQAEVEAACAAAMAHDFVTALPEGYHTRLLPGGGRLSGGERQRICIARALLAKAPILLLDEATSALDGENEAALRQALSGLEPGVTVLAIAHRLSSIREANRILVLAGGRVVADGRHEDLLATDAYRRLFGLGSGASQDPPS